MLALVFITGLHVALLQSVASLRMVVNYSRGTSFSEGVAKTLDGQNPCSMCVKIRKVQAEEKETSEAVGYSEKKSEAAILLTGSRLPEPLFSDMHFGPLAEMASTRSYPPMLQPPRSA